MPNVTILDKDTKDISYIFIFSSSFWKYDVLFYLAFLNFVLKISVNFNILVSKHVNK